MTTATTVPTGEEALPTCYFCKQPARDDDKTIAANDEDDVTAAELMEGAQILGVSHRLQYPLGIL